MKQFFRRSGEADSDEDLARSQRSRPLTRDEQRLMFEGSVHWGRGLMILLGMAAVLIVFLIVLTVLPKPGSGNPLDALTNLANSNSGAAAPDLSTATAVAARLATVVPPTPEATGTPGPAWAGNAPTGANVRPAPTTSNNPVGQLTPGSLVQVLGRSADGAWYQIVWTNNQKAWVSTTLFRITIGDPTKLPVASP